MSSSKKSVVEALEILKKAKHGEISATDLIKDSSKSLFVELNEDEYEQLQKERRERQFVTEDEDGLYADDGAEIWEEDGHNERTKKSRGPRRRRQVVSGIESSEGEDSDEEDENESDNEDDRRKSKKRKLSAAQRNEPAKGTQSLLSCFDKMASTGNRRRKERQIDNTGDVLSTLDAMMDDKSPESQPAAPVDQKNPRQEGGRTGVTGGLASLSLRGLGRRKDSQSDPPPPATQTPAIQHPVEEAVRVTAAPNDPPHEHPPEKPSEAVPVFAGISPREPEKVEEVKQEQPIPVKSEPTDERTMEVSSDLQMEFLTKTETQTLADLPVRSDGRLAVYWLDVIDGGEIQPSMNGSVVIIGKLGVEGGSFASIAVIVEHVDRTLYLPFSRQEFHNEEEESSHAKKVFEEFQDIRKKLKIPKFKAKPVTRHKADLVDPQRDVNCLKVVYSFKHPIIPLSNGETFTCPIPGPANPVETVILQRDLAGPGWILISDFQARPSSVSWCTYEVSIRTAMSIRVWNGRMFKEEMTEDQVQFLEDNPHEAKPTHKDGPSPPTPPLSVLSLSMMTAAQPGSRRRELVAVSALSIEKHRDDDEAIHQASWQKMPADASGHIWLRRIGGNWPMGMEEQAKGGPVLVGSEKALIVSLLTFIHRTDPDIILGHDIAGNGIELLHSRLATFKLPNWHRLSRVRRSMKPLAASSRGQWLVHHMTMGRLLVDTYIGAREFLSSQTNYTLQSLAKVTMADESINFPDRVNQEKLDKCLEEGTNLSINEWQSVVKEITSDAVLSFRLMCALQLLPLTRELTVLAGFLWTKSLLNKRAERNEFLLNHHFKQHKYFLPPKQNDQTEKDTADSKPTTYEGGLVLEPKAGLYDTFVLLLDFNSLYPSIIQEFNLCPSTIIAREDSSTLTLAGITTERPGILPVILKTLVNRRKDVKRLQASAQDPSKRVQLQVRQLALKLTANSIYGCLGYSRGRYKFMPVAALVTGQGRAILQQTKDTIERSFGLDVVYGDTDSVMVNTGLRDCGTGKNYQAAKEMGYKMASLINKSYSKLVLDVEHVFRRLLLLKKKKYAYQTIDSYEKKLTSTHWKGLDIVRRDWSVIVRKIGEKVLDIMFSPLSTEDVVAEIHDLLTQTSDNMDKHRVDISDYVITKALTKHPAAYSEKKGQPHLCVALKMIQRGIGVQAGNEIPFIITNENKDPNEQTKELTPFAERAVHPSEMEDSKLMPDTNWYKKQQLLPAIGRLCEHLEGTSMSRIASCLGLQGYSEETTSFNIPDHALPSQEFEDHTLPASLGALYSGESIAAETRELVDRINAYCPFCKSSEVPVTKAFAAASCPLCSAAWPTKYMSNLLQLVTSQIIMTHSMNVRRCPDCLVNTRRILLSNPKRCPQATCPSNETGEANLENALSAKTVTDLLMYLKILIGQSKNRAEPHVLKDFSVKQVDKAEHPPCPLLTYLEKLEKANTYSKIKLSWLFGPLVSMWAMKRAKTEKREQRTIKNDMRVKDEIMSARVPISQQ